MPDSLTEHAADDLFTLAPLEFKQRLTAKFGVGTGGTAEHFKVENNTTIDS